MKNAGEILFTQIVIIVNVEVFTVLSTASTLEAIVMYIYMYKQTGHWTSTGKKIAVLRNSQYDTTEQHPGGAGDTKRRLIPILEAVRKDGNSD